MMTQNFTATTAARHHATTAAFIARPFFASPHPRADGLPAVTRDSLSRHHHRRRRRVTSSSSSSSSSSSVVTRDDVVAGKDATVARVSYVCV